MIKFLPIEDVFGNISVFLLFAWFCASVLEIKKPVLTVGLGLVMYGVLLPMIDIQPVVTENIPSFVRFTCTMTVFWLFVQFGFVARYVEKLLAYFLGYSLITISQVVSTGILSLFRVDTAQHMEMLFALSSAIGFALMFMASRGWRSISLVATQRRFWTFLLIPTCQFALIAVMVYLMSKSGNVNLFIEASRNRWAALGIGAVFVLSLIADGLVMDSIARMAGSIREKERLKVLELENQLTYDYIKNMENDIVELRRYRHDFINMLSAVQLTIESGSENRDEEALGLIRQMTRELSVITGKHYCDCNIVNCILALAESKMTENGIEYELRAELPETLEVSELDLCRVMTNLFDNAVEYCQSMPEGEKRWIHSRVCLCEGYLYITVSNSLYGSKLTFSTSKKDKKQHGMGLEILRRITRKNGGELLVSEKEGSVEITATMRWGQSGEDR